MDLKVHCPKCSLALRVPPHSAGRRARCPTCHAVFTVPQLGDLVEETICTWIEEDVEQMQAEQQREWEQRVPPSPQATPAPSAGNYPKAIFGAEKGAAADRAGGSKTGAAGGGPTPEPSAAAAPAARPAPVPRPEPQPAGAASNEPDAAAPPSPAAPAETAAGNGHADAAAPRSAARVPPPPRPQPQVPAQPAPRPAEDAAVAVASDPRSVRSDQAAGAPLLSPSLPSPPRATAGAAAKPTTFPTSLEAPRPWPHLVVHSVSPEGVRLRFDANWMEHRGFKLSMPVRCAFSGVADPEELIARPLAFIDRSQAAVRDARQVEAAHQLPLAAHDSPRHIVEVMGLLDGLPKPFNSPVLYYVQKHHLRDSLVGTTHLREKDGGLTCDLLIPDGRYALDWVARVNGVCGPEYELLERAVATLWNDAWGRLSEETRHRISAWCEFLPMESFRAFLADADFAKKDYGLAGVVLTDRRIVYCKFHHRGAVGLDEEGVLVAQREGDFATLQLQTRDRRTRIGRLHAADLPVLAQELREAPRLKLQMAEQ